MSCCKRGTFLSRYWEVDLSGIMVGSSSAQTGIQSAIIDSGTTAIVMQNSDAAAIHSVRDLTEWFSSLDKMKKWCQHHS